MSDIYYTVDTKEDLRIARFLEADSSKTLKVGVVGDSLIDEYYQVVVNRISPEFPIALMQSNTEKPSVTVPGGAANVCCQFKHFNVSSSLISLINTEKSEIFAKHCNIDHSIILPEIVQPTKRRFYQDHFPISRWDVEQKNYGLDDTLLFCLQDDLIDLISKLEFDIIIYSDYNKGVLNGRFQKFLQASKNAITFVDPKKTIKGWEQCDYLKANYQEMHSYSDKKYIEEKILDIGFNNVVTTDGGRYVYYKDGRHVKIYNPEEKVEPNSVIGAGDCFMAFFAMAIARGLSLDNAVHIAFQAGKQYVKAKYNEPLTKENLVAATVCTNTAS